MTWDQEVLKQRIVAALSHQAKNGGHLHHRNCIHNLPPVEQVEMRGKTVEWWLRFGPMPRQITPDEWECEPPMLPGDTDE